MVTSPARPLVLIVEDEAILLLEAAAHLREDGFDVVEAGSGEQALVELSNGYSFDAVFTDINLGGELTGWDVANACRRKWPHIAVVYTSGQGADLSRQVEESLFFGKPYELEKIGAACRTLC
jgi:two-component system, response regulator PdtaR